MKTAGQKSSAGFNEATVVDLTLAPQWCSTQATARQRRLFQDTARTLIKIPAPNADPLGHLLGEADWRRLVPPDDREEEVLTALSQDTGVYFFPSREWATQFCRFIHFLGIRRVLEAGAGRGYLAAALAPLLAHRGIAFRAVDTAQGEFESGLPRHEKVEQAAALAAVQDFSPALVIYAWPPPGQSVGPICRCAGVRYVLIIGESGGGCTGDPADWQRFKYRTIKALSSLGLGRSGRRQQAATLFFGSAHPDFQ